MDDGPQGLKSSSLSGPDSEHHSFLTLGQKGKGHAQVHAKNADNVSRQPFQRGFISACFRKGNLWYFPTLASPVQLPTDRGESFFWVRTGHSKLRLGSDSLLFSMVTQSLFTLSPGACKAPSSLILKLQGTESLKNR